MTFARDLSGNNPTDLKYSPSSRTAADLTAVLALTPLYPGEIVKALNTGRNYRAVGASTWGLIGPVTSVVAGTLPRPSVTINQAVGQADPTTGSTISYTVVFSQDVTGFVAGDVTLTGATGGTVTSVSGGPSTYTVNVTGMATPGTVTASIAANVATGVGGLNFASTSTDNVVTWALPATPPTVIINKAAGQADPSNASSILFDVVFSEAVTGFASGDIDLSASNVGTIAASVSGSGATYVVTVTGMTFDGNVIASVPADVAIDAGGDPNLASTSTDNTVAWDGTRPGPTINRGPTQDETTSVSPIIFAVGWSEPVVGFTNADVSFVGSTVGGTLSVVLTSTGPTTYDVSVTGMTTNGTVIATIPENVCTDVVGNLSIASFSVINVVNWTGGGGGGTFPDDTTAASEFPILFI